MQEKIRKEKEMQRKTEDEKSDEKISTNERFVPSEEIASKKVSNSDYEENIKRKFILCSIDNESKRNQYWHV